MQLLDLSGEKLPADYYLPVKTVDVASGATETVKIQGLNADRFGVTRVIMGERDTYASGFGNAEDFTVTARLVNAREFWFEEVNGMAITALFRNYTMQVPEVIPAGEEVEFTITNHAASSKHAVIGLQGLTARQLEVREETIRQQLGFVPKKGWIYTDNSEIAANATEAKDLHKDSHAQVFGKIGFGGEDVLRYIDVRLLERTITRLERIPLAMYHHVADNLPGDDPYLFITKPKETLSIEFTETNGSAKRAGALADTLPVEVLDEIGIEY